MMPFRTRLLSTFCTLALCCAFTSQAQPATATRPNILFLFADDFAPDAVRALAGTDIDTPNLDRLVARGTAFTSAYNMGAWQPAVCIASRTMLITGRSLWNAHAIYEKTDGEREAGRLWPQLLAAKGYKTYFTGKWHIRADAARAFDVARHIRPGMPKDVPAGYNRPLAGQPDPWHPADPKFGGFWEGGKHWSEVTADDAITFLRDPQEGGKPFFMYVAFNAPHDPRQAPQAFLDRYPLSRIALPPSFQAEYPYNEAIGSSPTLRDERLAPFPRTEHAIKTHRREYFAIISHLDAQIGRVLAALDASGQADNTWIFFTADHGLAVGHHGLLGKQNMYEPSVRVPFIVVGPGVDPGRRVAAPVYLQDVMPTTLELAGAAKPSHVFFHSLLPLLRNETVRSPYRSIYGAYVDRQRAIAHDGWKLIVYPTANVMRLFHVERDPDELVDLAADPRYRARKHELFTRLQALQRELGDPLQLPF